MRESRMGVRWCRSICLFVSVWRAAHASAGTLRSPVALVLGGVSLASPLLAPGASSSRATALVARNRRFLISPS